MTRRYYDRYEEFRFNGKIKILPFLKIPRKSTDLRVEYKANSRLDIISDEYYNNPTFGWLILQANPQYGSMEFDIPVGSVLNIPFPLQGSLTDYEKQITKYKKLYGI